MKAPLKILITNQKGGVGKSTIAANLAAYFARCAGKKTSLIDFDFQASSSSWVNEAEEIGINCKKISLPNAKGAGNAFLMAKDALRNIYEASQVIICDLAWVDVLPPEFLFEFDIVLVPVSMSRIEQKSTLDFVSRFSFVFNSRLRNSPKLAIVPSFVRNAKNVEALYEEVFQNDIALSRPVMFSTRADAYFGSQYFVIHGTEAERESFMQFGQSVVELAEREVSHKQHTKDANFQHKVSGSVLDRFRAIRHSSQHQDKRQVAKAAELAEEAAAVQIQASIPSFLALRTEA